jgi:hypothetical protein
MSLFIRLKIEDTEQLITRSSDSLSYVMVEGKTKVAQQVLLLKYYT